MEASSCAIVKPSEQAYVTIDARLVGLRWDLIPWSLVLDLDSPIAEGMPVTMKRIWLCFHLVSEVTLPWEKVRLPTGCWLTSSVQGNERPDGFIDFGVVGLLNRFEGNQAVLSEKPKEIVIAAKDMVAVASLKTAEKGEFGLDREVRQGLASDEELLGLLKASLE